MFLPASDMVSPKVYLTVLMSLNLKTTRPPVRPSLSIFSTFSTVTPPPILAAAASAFLASAKFGPAPPWAAIIALASALKTVSSVMVPLPSLFRRMVELCSRQELVNSASRAAPRRLRDFFMAAGKAA